MRLGNLLVLLPLILTAQERPLSVTWQGMTIRFAAKVEPASDGAARFPGSVIPSSGVTHRLITDLAGKRKFGYNLLMEAAPDSQTMRLTFRPLSLPPSIQLEPGYELLAPPKFPVVPVLRVGDTVALELMINPATGQKLVDYLSLDRAGTDGVRPGRIAQDFDTKDVELTLDTPRVWVNGKLVEAGPQSGGGIKAHALALYLAGKGAFVISLWPEPDLGFQKAGTLEGGTMSFRVGSSEYRVECNGAIAPGSGLYNVYVHNDPAWGPRGSNTRLEMIGGADRAAWLVQKR